MSGQKIDDLIQVLKNLPAVEGAHLVMEYKRQFEKQPRPDAWDDFWYSGPAFQSKTGLTINENTALRYSAVWACVKVISETLAMLPLIIYRRKGKQKERAPDHPLYPLLHDAPNPEMSAMQFREALQGHALLWGNGYAQIQKNLRGQPIALWPLRPDRMTPKRINNDLVYDYYAQDGTHFVFPKEEILHIGGLGFNGLVGYSVIGHHRESIGLGLAMEEYGSRFFDGDSMPRVALVHPATLTEEGRKNIKAGWHAAYGGLGNVHGIAVLEEGMKPEKIGMPNKDAEFIDGRKYQSREIARIFRVPPHKIMDLENATFSNIEHQSIEFVTDTIAPWAIRWEQAIKLRGLQGEEYYAEHLVDGLLRGDIASRYAAYAVGRNWGWLSANDIRSFENMNPIDGGDDYLQPLNMVPIGSEDEPITEKEKEQAAQALRALKLVRRK